MEASTHSILASIKSVNITSVKNVLLLTSYALVNLMIGMIYSIQAPFYPSEAESKNATATEYGLVFSSYELVQILAMPLIGVHLTKIGTMNAFTIGMIGSSISTILFGFVSLINARAGFIIVSIILRVLDSFASGIVYIAIFVLVNGEIPGATARNMAIGQSFCCIGMSIGPAVGSVFYNMGGFPGPYVTLGSGQFIVYGMTMCALKINHPDLYKTTNAITMTLSGEKKRKNFGYKRLIRIPSVFLHSCCVMISAQSIAFVLTLLEPHLRQFDLSETMIGLVFLMNGLAYAIGFSSSAVISDKIKRTSRITLIGSLSLTISTFIIGPTPFFQFDQKLWLTVLSLVLLSAGAAAVQSSANTLSLREALKNGFPDDDSTSALMTGLYLENLGIGSFSGPIIAGVLFDNFGFINATVFLMVVNLMATMALMAYTCTTNDSEVSVEYIRNPPNENTSLMFKEEGQRFLNHLEGISSLKKSDTDKTLHSNLTAIG